MEVMVAVDRQACCSIRRLKRPLMAMSSSAPTEPTEAASVGVAMPPRMEPRTARISARGGSRAVTISRPRPWPPSSRWKGVAGQDLGSKIALPAM